jgi:hypothetical protein
VNSEHARKVAQLCPLPAILCKKYNEKNPSNVYEKFHGIPWKIPWNLMEFHGKFHELTERFSPGNLFKNGYIKM